MSNSEGRSILERLFDRLVAKLGARSIRNAIEKYRIDQDSAVFRIGPEIWRYVQRDRAVDFFVAIDFGNKLVIDLDGFGPWHGEIESPCGLERLVADAGRTRELSLAERTLIAERISAKLRVDGWNVHIQSSSVRTD